MIVSLYINDKRGETPNTDVKPLKKTKNIEREEKMIYYQQKAEEKEEKIHAIEVQRIVPNPNQPRKIFNEDSIIKLADSINQYGIIQPLTVRKVGEYYELVAGERRLRAAKELGLSTVPCIITSINEAKSAEISIIENLIREDLNMFEQAEAIEALIDTYGLTQEQIASKLSNSQSFIANKLRLLRYNSEERETILKNGLTERHARALLRVLDLNLRAKLLNKIVSEGLNVSASEELIESHISSEKPEQAAVKVGYKNVNAFYSAINRAIDNIKSSGIDIKSRRVEGDKFTELTILIPKQDSTADLCIKVAN